MSIPKQATKPETVSRRVKPSKVQPSNAKPFTLDQELEQFGSWSSQPIWVPPKDASKEMAETMLQKSRLFSSREESWAKVIDAHRTEFSQVREIEMAKASIRLPKTKLFVSVTEQNRFDEIEEAIPACVQTRLDEFMAGPGKRYGVKVSYLKPLCVEVDDELIFTSHDDIISAITKIQDEVFAEYRKRLVPRAIKQSAIGAVNASLAMPRAGINFVVNRQKRALDAYHARLEFKRRKTALRAMRTHQRCRTNGCTFDEMLSLTNPLEVADVIEQYGIEQELSQAKREQMLMMAAGKLPWFVAISMGIAYISTVSVTAAPPLMVCDPAFVAEMPGSNGELLKIGHFDEVAGVTHVEI